MAVEASRTARSPCARRSDRVPVVRDGVPPYLDKTNATAIHAALRLPGGMRLRTTLIGSVRGAMGALRAAVAQTGPALAVAADVRTGLAGGPDEAYFGDGAAALVIGDDTDGAIVAELGRVGLADRRVRRPLAPSRRRALTGVGGALRRGALRRRRQGRARPPVQGDRNRAGGRGPSHRHRDAQSGLPRRGPAVRCPRRSAWWTISARRWATRARPIPSCSCRPCSNRRSPTRRSCSSCWPTVPRR